MADFIDVVGAINSVISLCEGGGGEGGHRTTGQKVMEGAETVHQFGELGALATGNHAVERVLGPAGALFGGYNMAKGFDQLAKGKTVEEGNKGVDSVFEGAGSVVGAIPNPIAKAIGVGLQMAPKIAHAVEGSSRALGAYGTDEQGKNMSLSEHAASVGASTQDTGFHTDENGKTTPNEEYGPSAGGIAATLGQTALDALTFQARMAAKAAQAVVNTAVAPVGQVMFDAEDRKLDRGAAVEGLVDSSLQYTQALSGGDPVAVEKAKARYDYMKEMQKSPMQRAVDQAIAATGVTAEVESVIPPLDGWTFDADEDGVSLRLAGEPEAGEIRYTERLRPLLPFGERIGARCRAQGLRVVSFAPPADLITHEGEHAQEIAFEARVAGRPAQVVMGHVLVDDFFSEIVAVVRDPGARPGFAAAVRTLLCEDTHGMALRRRRFLCQAPAGWRAAARGSVLDRVWNGDAAELVVPAAVPGDACPMAAAPPAGAQVRATSALRSAAGIDWQVTELRLPGGGARLWALARHARFFYALHLDTDDAARHRPVLEAVVRSVQPIPGGRRCASHLELFEHQIA